MNILGLFLNNQMRTGANRRYLELMESLAERGNRVHVLMNSYLPYEPRYFVRIDIPVRYKRKSFPPASFLFTRAVKNWYAAGELPSFEWIHIHSDMHLAASVFLSERTGARLFYAVRCDDITRGRILLRSRMLPLRTAAFLTFYNRFINIPRERRIARKADRIAFMNRADRDNCVARTALDPEKTIVVYGNIWPPRFTEEWKNKNSSSSVRKLIYAGVLSTSKGFAHVLKALALLKARGFDDLVLYALGRTENLDPVRELAANLGIGDHVVFTGYVDPFPYFADCDLLVYPSLYDAWPDVVMEAIHVGCPAIASRVGGLPELLEYDELLFDSGDVVGMADIVERAIVDADFYARMRKLCTARAEALTFDWAVAMEKAMAEGSDSPEKNREVGVRP